MAAGDDYTVGATGGEAKHMLSMNELPIRTLVSIQNTSSSTVSMSGIAWGGVSASKGSFFVSSIHDIASNVPSLISSENVAHNNMPPYLVAYMWYRTA